MLLDYLTHIKLNMKSIKAAFQFIYEDKSTIIEGIETESALLVLKSEALFKMGFKDFNLNDIDTYHKNNIISKDDEKKQIKTLFSYRTLENSSILPIKIKLTTFLKASKKFIKKNLKILNSLNNTSINTNTNNLRSTAISKTSYSNNKDAKTKIKTHNSNIDNIYSNSITNNTNTNECHLLEKNNSSKSQRSEKNINTTNNKTKQTNDQIIIQDNQIPSFLSHKNSKKALENPLALIKDNDKTNDKGEKDNKHSYSMIQGNNHKNSVKNMSNRVGLMLCKVKVSNFNSKAEIISEIETDLIKTGILDVKSFLMHNSLEYISFTFDNQANGNYLYSFLNKLKNQKKSFHNIKVTISYGAKVKEESFEEFNTNNYNKYSHNNINNKDVNHFYNRKVSSNNYNSNNDYYSNYNSTVNDNKQSNVLLTAVNIKDNKFNPNISDSEISNTKSKYKCLNTNNRVLSGISNLNSLKMTNDNNSKPNETTIPKYNSLKLVTLNNKNRIKPNSKDASNTSKANNTKSHSLLNQNKKSNLVNNDYIKLNNNNNRNRNSNTNFTSELNHNNNDIKSNPNLYNPIKLIYGSKNKSINQSDIYLNSILKSNDLMVSLRNKSQSPTTNLHLTTKSRKDLSYFTTKTLSKPKDKSESPNNTVLQKYNLALTLNLPVEVKRDVNLTREIFFAKQQEILDEIKPIFNRIGSPYISQEEMRKLEYFHNKQRWVSKNNFNLATNKAFINKLPEIKNFVMATPSQPPVLHNFRDVKKNKWIDKKKGFKLY